MTKASVGLPSVCGRGSVLLVLVDLVLTGDGSYWRKRVQLAAAPPRGEQLVLLRAPDVIGVVVGSATPFEDDGTVAAVLLRVAPTGNPLTALDRGDGLREAGWSLLI